MIKHKLNNLNKPILEKFILFKLKLNVKMFNSNSNTPETKSIFHFCFQTYILMANFLLLLLFLLILGFIKGNYTFQVGYYFQYFLFVSTNNTSKK